MNLLSPDASSSEIPSLIVILLGGTENVDKECERSQFLSEHFMDFLWAQSAGAFFGFSKESSDALF